MSEKKKMVPILLNLPEDLYEKLESYRVQQASERKFATRSATLRTLLAQALKALEPEQEILPTDLLEGD